METTETTSMMAPAAPKRPVFLTVLCILTFVYSGWVVYHSVKDYVTAEATAARASEKLGETEDKMTSDTPSFAKSIMSSAASMANPGIIRESSLFSLAACLFCLSGAILMWMLKKNGFYLYITGTLISIAAPLIVLGGALAGIAAGGAAFIGLIFVIMYGVNLKYMN